MERVLEWGGRWWWAVGLAVALAGYLRSLAGVTRAQRARWATARVVEVRTPAHGASGREGVPVTLAFQDPDSGREFVLTNEGRHGDAVEVAWVGRQFTVRYPPGQPERFHLMADTAGERSGLGGPNCLLQLIALGLAVQGALAWGWGWGLVGFGALLLFNGLMSDDVFEARVRRDRLAAALDVPARVVAVTKDVHHDAEGDLVAHAPVLVFTTHDGTRVTALCRDGIPRPGLSLGRELTVHYAPDDPAVHTPDPDFDRRDRAKSVGCVLLLVLGGTAAVAVGCALI